MSEPRKADIRLAYAIDRAKRLGTFNQIDRRAQYEGPERATPAALLDSINELGNTARRLRADNDRLQRALLNVKLRNSIIVAILTGLLSNAPAIWRFLAHLLP